jgi:hypothetical protein
MTTGKLLVLLVMFAACAPQVGDADRPGDANDGSPADIPELIAQVPPEPVPADFHIQLRRTPCFGTCPVYTVEVDAGGAVLFDGERYVGAEGMHHAEIEAEAVSRLWQAVRGADFFGLDERYDHEHPACSPYATDAPGIVLEVTSDGRTHRTILDGGCANPPRVIDQLANAIDQETGTDRWIARP